MSALIRCACGCDKVLSLDEFLEGDHSSRASRNERAAAAMLRCAAAFVDGGQWYSPITALDSAHQLTTAAVPCSSTAYVIARHELCRAVDVDPHVNGELWAWQGRTTNRTARVAALRLAAMNIERLAEARRLGVKFAEVPA